MLACIVTTCVPPVQPAARVALPTPPPPKPPDVCAIVERTQRAALLEPTSCAPPRSRHHATRCVHAGLGAWGLVVEQTDWNGRDFDCGVLLEGVEFGMVAPHFRARALYVDERGRASIGPLLSWSTLEDVRAFDYDGDGVAELLVSATRSNEEGLNEHFPFQTHFGVVWAVRDGAVVAYAPSASIVIRSFSDVDGDGRPDLITTRGVSVETDDGDVTSYTLEGPEWAAHALPSGKFSFDDSVATSHIRRFCADESLRTADALGLVRAAACARANGESPKLVERDYVARCNELARANEPWSVMRATCRADPHGAAPDTRAMPDELRKLLE